MSVSCFLRGKDSLACGPSHRRENLCRLLDCKDDIRTHLATYHLSRESVNEYELILARRGFFMSQQQMEELWICPKHRHELDKFWRESNVDDCTSGCTNKEFKNPNPKYLRLFLVFSGAPTVCCRYRRTFSSR